MTPYPNAEDYVRAVQRPAAFRTPALRRAVLEVHPLFGIPMPASGSAAVVFKAAVDGRPQALRFFIHEDASSRERYAALGHHFDTSGLRACVAAPTWVDDAIEVGGRPWPMVQMEWVEGRALDAYVGHLAERRDVGALALLAREWRGSVHRLQDAEFAHGDLQHGNVLVDTSSALRLVDFDGSWIAAFAGGAAPKETGHPNYQRTGRTWGRWMDTFPALVIYTSLLALTRRPDAWQVLHNGENMLFSQGDFAPPFTTPAWRFLDGIGDPEMAAAVARLRRCCAPQWSAEGTLEKVLGREQVMAATAPPPPPLVVDPDLPWWERTEPGTATAPPFVPSPRTEMPAPPSKAGPQPGAATGPVYAGPREGETWFGQGTVPAGTRPPPARGARAPQPGPVRPRGSSQGASPPAARNAGRAALIAAGVAVLAALLAAAISTSEYGNPGVAAAATGLFAFVLVFLIALFA